MYSMCWPKILPIVVSRVHKVTLKSPVLLVSDKSLICKKTRVILVCVFFFRCFHDMACYLPHRGVDLKSSDTQSEVSETGTTTSGFNSNWSSREDLRDFVAKHGLKDISELYQERFRVDRRKLEQMLSGDNNALIPADVFFAKIMEDTDTYITWPNKLKLGAKSKKDPHVRIAGKPEDVRAAKARIMSILHTTCNRVIMKMDISYTDHSHIIGKGGLSIKRVMDETQCHVHFPDSNRSNPNEKSNQVSISGDIEGVECARSRVRELIPLIFGFEPPIKAQNIDNTCPYVIKIQEQYKVQVMFKTRSKLHATIVLVKGVEWEVEQVKQATLLLMDYMCESLASQISVQMSIQISPQHHQTVLGKNHSNLKAIMQYTKCQIMFPDAQDQNIPSLKKSNINISGNIHNVYIARQLLIGSLPLLIIFDLPEDTAGLRIRSEQINEIQTGCDVTINIRQKTKHAIKACIIKGSERHANNVYKARNLILGIEEPAIVADIPRNYHIPNAPPVSAAPSSPFSPGGITCSGSQHELLTTPTNLAPSPLSPLLNPMFSWHYSPTVNPNNPPPFVGMFKDNSGFWYNAPSPNACMQQTSTNGASFQSFGGGFPMADQPAADQNSILSSISSKSSLSSFLQSPSRTSLSSASPQKYKNYGEQSCCSSDKMGEAISQTSDYQSLTENKNQERPSPMGAFEQGSKSTYESKRMAGLKAMQSRPTPGMCRVPNSAWSGYGISHTSPAGFGAAANNKEEDIWKSPERYYPCPPSTSSGMNSSNMLEHTPTHLVNRVTGGVWSDLSSLLNCLGLERYVGLFVQQEVDLATFATFSEKDLVTIGVSTFGSRRKMLLAIAELNKRSAPFSMAPGAERRRSSNSPLGNW